MWISLFAFLCCVSSLLNEGDFVRGEVVELVDDFVNLGFKGGEVGGGVALVGGVDIVDRLHILRKNYRTSLQIQKQVERLLPSSLTDVDGHSENRERTQSAFNGPEPIIQTFDDGQKEIDFITQWLSALINDNGVAPDEIAIFVRVMEQLEKASSVAVDPRIVIDVMQNGKGLEFRAVVLMACNEGVVPSQDRLERYLGDLGIGEIYNTERQLLYVAATRAREHLLITGVKPASEFLNDLI